MKMECIFETFRQSPWPLSVAVIGDVIYWTDEHLLDLFSHETKNPEHRERLALNVGHLGALAAIDADSQPPGKHAIWCISISSYITNLRFLKQK
jgi:hypothetical protein